MTQLMGIQLIWDQEFASWWRVNRHQYPEDIREQLAEAFAAGREELKNAPITFRTDQKEKIKEAVVDAVREQAREIANTVGTTISEKSKKKIRDAVNEHAWNIAYETVSELPDK